MAESLISIAILAAIALLHVYLWRRLVLKMSAEGSEWRIVDSVIAACSWAFVTLTLVSGPDGAPVAALDFVARAGIT